MKEIETPKKCMFSIPAEPTDSIVHLLYHCYPLHTKGDTNTLGLRDHIFLLHLFESPQKWPTKSGHRPHHIHELNAGADDRPDFP